MTRETDPLTAIDQALTVDQKREITRRSVDITPRWLGATAADILEALADHDSNLDETEPFFEAHPDLAKVPGAGYAARALIWSGEGLNAQAMRKLLSAAGLLEEPACPGTAVADRIVHWDEVRKGDLALHGGQLKAVELAYLHHTPELGERVHIRFTCDRDPYLLRREDYTAVRRVTGDQP